MKARQEMVFRCDFCNKSMLSKGAMSLHERMCKENPKNKHKCFQYCVWINRDFNEGNTVFYCGCDKCDFFDKDLYSYKLERNYNGQKMIEVEGLTRMPLHCEHYEIEDGHDDFFKQDKEEQQ